MKSAALFLTLTASLWLIGCGVTLGPKVKDRIVMVETTTQKERVVEVVQIAEKREVECWTEDAQGQVFVDHLKLDDTWKAVRPDVARADGLVAPRIAVSIVLKCYTEDGKLDRMNLGGWYVVPLPVRPAEKADTTEKVGAITYGGGNK